MKFQNKKIALHTIYKAKIRNNVWALTDSNRRPSACKADARTLPFQKRCKGTAYFEITKTFAIYFSSFFSHNINYY